MLRSFPKINVEEKTDNNNLSYCSFLKWFKTNGCKRRLLFLHLPDRKFNTLRQMIISAKNQLKGRIIRISDGAINSELVIELAPGVEITSIITKSYEENWCILRIK